MPVVRSSDADINQRRCEGSRAEWVKLFWFRSARSLVFIQLQLRDVICDCLESELAQALSDACLLAVEELEKKVQR